jgi:hypothetical protein
MAFSGLTCIALHLLAPDEAVGLLRSIVGDDCGTLAELGRIGRV